MEYFFKSRGCWFNPTQGFSTEQQLSHLPWPRETTYWMAPHVAACVGCKVNFPEWDFSVCFWTVGGDIVPPHRQTINYHQGVNQWPSRWSIWSHVPFMSTRGPLVDALVYTSRRTPHIFNTFPVIPLSFDILLHNQAGVWKITMLFTHAVGRTFSFTKTTLWRNRSKDVLDFIQSLLEVKTNHLRNFNKVVSTFGFTVSL